MTEILAYKSDNLIEVSGLKNRALDTFINNANVTVTLKDKDGAEVVGETWPLTLDKVAGTDGLYRASLKDTLTLGLNEKVTAEVNADGGTGLQSYWEKPLIVRLQKGV